MTRFVFLSPKKKKKLQKYQFLIKVREVERYVKVVT